MANRDIKINMMNVLSSPHHESDANENMSDGRKVSRESQVVFLKLTFLSWILNQSLSFFSYCYGSAGVWNDAFLPAPGLVYPGQAIL